jgi:hypothetical protein
MGAGALGRADCPWCLKCHPQCPVNLALGVTPTINCSLPIRGFRAWISITGLG